uniref:Uncharacterized protein n=1 Tax=viral metagenome TaxID=1070528 RepID=A0A6M3XKL0_9ZZZZ
MNIMLGTAASEVTFTNVIIGTSRQKVASVITMIDGSKKIQEAVNIKRVFDVILIKPTATEVTNIETEYDKGTTLNFIHKTVTYTVKFIGNLDKTTGDYAINFTLQEC